MRNVETSLSAKIIRNVVSSGLRVVLLAPLPFIMTPLILRKIGTAGYGTWAVFVALNSLTSLADLGMVGTVSKYVAEYYAHKDFQGLNRLLNTGLVIFAVISCTVGLVVWSSSRLITSTLFKGSSAPTGELAVLLKYFVIVISANILTLLLSSVTTGLQRLDLSSWIGTINVLGVAIIGGGLLLRGWGLEGLVFGQVCASILTVATYAVVVKRLLPEARLKMESVDRAEAKKMFSFSLRLYITQAAVAVQNQLEKFLLALFVGVPAAGWYDMGGDIALKLRGLISLVLGPILPAASELNALNDEQRLKELYYRAQKYLAFFGVPLACYVTVIARRFVGLWVGPQLSFVAVPLAVLLWVNFFNLVTGPGFLIFAGKGHLSPGIRSAMASIILNVVFSVPLIYWLGFAGAVVGTSLSVVFGSTYFIYLFHTQTGYSVSRLLREAYGKPLICGIVVGTGLWMACREIAPSWVRLGVFGVLFGVVYVAAVLGSRFFDRYDWSKIESLVPMARHARWLIPVA